MLKRIKIPRIPRNYIHLSHKIKESKLLRVGNPAAIRYDLDFSYVEKKIQQYKSAYGFNPIVLFRNKGQQIEYHVEHPPNMCHKPKPDLFSRRIFYQTDFIFCKNADVAIKKCHLVRCCVFPINSPEQQEFHKLFTKTFRVV